MVMLRQSQFTRDLLAEQQDLSAIDRYSAWHEQAETVVEPALYRDLIPLSAPGPGQQYAFEVDLDLCSGCKSCVSACHSLNGLDQGEAWREIGLLISDDWRQPFQQTITTACHHCIDPACLNGCPVLAYDKDPATGIVRHLDDQCIGCQYCVLKCPYEAPRYSRDRGIVRKCDMCSNRLRAGEPPACVQACPHEAIRITLVDSTADFSRPFLPVGPDASTTLPTTRFKSSRTLPDSLRAVDRETVRPEPPHTPLVFMLVLSQLSVGLFLLERLMAWATAPTASTSPPAVQLWSGLFGGLAAIGVSVSHLGRPLGAWRSFLNLRRSWLSREIVVFGLYLPLAALAALAAGAPRILPRLSAAIADAATLCGLLGVFCSAKLYADTRREFWKLSWTAGKFFASTVLLGVAGTLASIAWFGCPPPLWLALNAILILSAVFKLAIDHCVTRHLADDDFSPLHKTALLLAGRFGLVYRARLALGIIGGVLVPTLLIVGTFPSAERQSFYPGLASALMFAACLAGELIERHLFFTAVQPVKMPGAIAS